MAAAGLKSSKEDSVNVVGLVRENEQCMEVHVSVDTNHDFESGELYRIEPKHSFFDIETHTHIASN